MTQLLAYLRTPGITRHRTRRRAACPPAPLTEYHFTGYHKFLDPDGYPAIAPPWGTLNAIDLNTGKYLWKIPLGEYPELAAQGLSNTGSENYGGPIVTAGGLVFIGATVYDRKFRAFDAATGQLLWETDAALRRNRHALHLLHRRQAIRRHRRQRRTRSQIPGRRQLHRFRVAVAPQADAPNRAPPTLSVRLLPKIFSVKFDRPCHTVIGRLLPYLLHPVRSQAVDLDPIENRFSVRPAARR